MKTNADPRSPLDKAVRRARDELGATVERREGPGKVHDLTVVAKAEDLMRSTGLSARDHFWPYATGAGPYCACGAVEDHNAAYDRALEAAARRVGRSHE